jgi:hypothetical protein
VGFNPFRKHVTDRLDLVLIAAAMLVCVGLVLWAILA